MAFEQIITEVSERVLTITLNRPERLNAWTPRMAEELIEAFDRADADDEVRVVIVTGAGRGFCAGADLAAGGETFDYRKRESAEPVPRDNGGQVVLRIFACTKPVIAAINGPAVGIGATMTLPMDIRLAADDARMGFVFVRRGIVPEACSSWFLPRIVGISRAMEWVATGRVFPAREGLDGGLLRSLHPAGELLEAAREIAREIAENTAPVSVALARRMLWTMRAPEHPMRRSTGRTRGGCSTAASPPTRPRASPPSSRSARPNSPNAWVTGCRTSCRVGLPRSSNSDPSDAGLRRKSAAHHGILERLIVALVLVRVGNGEVRDGAVEDIRFSPGRKRSRCDRPSVRGPRASVQPHIRPHNSIPAGVIPAMSAEPFQSRSWRR